MKSRKVLPEKKKGPNQADTIASSEEYLLHWQHCLHSRPIDASTFDHGFAFVFIEWTQASTSSSLDRHGFLHMRQLVIQVQLLDGDGLHLDKRLTPLRTDLVQ